MQSSNKGVALQKALLLLDELPESPRINQAIKLLLDELDEGEGPSQDEVLGAAKGQVEEIRPAARGQGSYVLQRIKCGDPSCHCMKKPEDYHGPYWYLFTKKNGKTRSKYVGKSLPAEVS
ncbi:MAG: hypothetical protein PHS80_02670 [Methanothrix sp.]|nr:hypothetical protein [Methanothrix sp.]